MISRILKKINAAKAVGILVIPYLLNYAWFPVLFTMLIVKPVLINSRKNLLRLPQNPELKHPMWSNIGMVVFHVAGLLQKLMEFQSRLKTYRKKQHDRQQGKDMLGMYSHSRNIVISGTSIRFRQPLTYTYVFHRIFSYWSRLLICKHSQACFIPCNQN